MNTVSYHFVRCSACDQRVQAIQLYNHWDAAHPSSTVPESKRYFVLTDPSDSESIHLFQSDNGHTEPSTNVQDVTPPSSASIDESASFPDQISTCTSGLSINVQNMNHWGSSPSETTMEVPITTNIHTESFNAILSEISCELNGQYSEDWNDLESTDIANGAHSHESKKDCCYLRSTTISQCDDSKQEHHWTEMCLAPLPSLRCIPRQNSVFNIEDIFDCQTTIGFGSSCTVIKAQNIENGELVALKQLPKSQQNCGDGRESAKLLSNERAILDALAQHQNVVKLLAVYETPSHYFLATELLTGGTLLEKVLSSNPDEMRAARYLHDVLSAVSYMHSMDIVHNDLKLENIVLTKPGSDGVVKLIDFGHSQFVSPSRNYKSVFGTLHYIPPEITRSVGDGRSGKELKKSDVWSIGVCCYVLVTGYIPFSGNTMKEVLENIKRHKKDGLRFPKNCKLKKDCVDFMKKLLCFDVNARLTADEALRHPFITGSAHAENTIDDSIEADDSSSSNDPYQLNVNNWEMNENVPEATPTPDQASLNRSSGSGVDTDLMSSIED